LAFLGSRRVTAMFHPQRRQREPQAGAASDTPDGDRCARAKAGDDQARARQQD
jgi:hypothetical protein